MHNQRVQFIEALMAASQRHVEVALRSAEQAVDLWRQSSEDAALRAAASVAIGELQTTVEQHFARLAGEGLIEDAVSASPQLYPKLRELEEWQTSLADRAAEIVAQMKLVSTTADAHELTKSLKRFRAELLREEQQEREIIDRGLH